MFNVNRRLLTETKEMMESKKTQLYEEIIGRRHVKYTFSPNGTIQVAVRSNDTPFKLECDVDESFIFSFFGQVRDRLLYLVGDVKELIIPSLMEWRLKQFDVNKDIEIDEKAQLTMPDIQLKYAGRVFREYVKIIQGKAYYRMEESVRLSKVLPEALDNIRQPFISLERKIDNLTEKFDQLNSRQIKDSLTMKHGSDPNEMAGKQSNAEGESS
jgi:hypothetical protein